MCSSPDSSSKPNRSLSSFSFPFLASSSWLDAWGLALPSRMEVDFRNLGYPLDAERDDHSALVEGDVRAVSSISSSFRPLPPSPSISPLHTFHSPPFSVIQYKLNRSRRLESDDGDGGARGFAGGLTWIVDLFHESDYRPVFKKAFGQCLPSHLLSLS